MPTPFPDLAAGLAATAAARPLPLVRVRDHSLLSTELGERLFEALFDEYYRFGARLCQLLDGQPEARATVERWLVRPLVRALGLASDYTSDPLDFARLGGEILADADAGLFIPAGQPEEWRQALAVLEAVRREPPRRRGLPRLDGATAEVVDLLAAHLPQCPHVTWGIGEPLRLYAELRLWIERCAGDPPSPAAVGTALAFAFDDWLARVPFAALEGMRPDDVAADLERLATTLSRNPGMQRRLAGRVAATTA